MSQTRSRRGVEQRQAQGLAPGSLPLRYGVATLAVALTLLVRFMLLPIMGYDAPLIIFTIPILISAWYGGLGPGLFATFLAVTLGPYFFVLPRLPLTEPVSIIRIIMLIVNGTVASLLFHYLYKAIHQSHQKTKALEASESFLQERESHYHFALRSARAGAWERDLTTGSVIFAEETYDFYGIEPGTPVTIEHWEACVHPEDREQQRQLIADALTDRQDIIEGEFRIFHPKRGIRWIKRRGRIIYSPDGTPLRMMGIALDITTEKAGEEAKQQLLLERALAMHIEAERVRIGKELHDGIRQQLTGIQMLSRTLHKRLLKQGDASASTMGEFAHMVGDANAEVRRLISGLVPQRIEGHSLASALKRAAQNIEQWYDVPCQVLHEPGVSVADSDKATHLYYLAKEAMTNAGKHAKASCITVRLECRDVEVTLTVQDDGVGLADDFDQRGGLGVQGLHDRAALMGAHLFIGKGESGGTIVQCRLRDKQQA